ncbi:glycosyltransferase family 9 protein [Psychromonas hadalis]|uniref:glycosyltransferase family 9 protein n=1 Tax=Psychromonas hadalis TaxID=211669 RepID=UPI000421B73E|nr:glycosyltransferase family 9 protein [Psychromonas hadalis]
MKILVVRNDKIGDFMLAWPSFAMLKQSLPHIQIDALVPAYTKPLAELCPWIDNVIIDSAKKEDQTSLVATIKAQHYSDYICLFSTTRNALLGYRSKIPYRLAPATKLAQFLFTARLKQRRSQSAKPESEYNLDLIRHYLQHKKVSVIEVKAPFLTVDKEVQKQFKKGLYCSFSNNIKKLCFVHAGSGGSANNLSLDQYAQLINLISKAHPEFGFVLTAGPSEEAQAKELQQLLETQVESHLYQSTQGLVSFAQTISCADLFIAGSTGPLHIAGACDVPTVGFFPAKRSATPLRWKPLNSEKRHIAFTPQTGGKVQDDMQMIDIDEIKQKLLAFLS